MSFVLSVLLFCNFCSVPVDQSGILELADSHWDRHVRKVNLEEKKDITFPSLGKRPPVLSHLGPPQRQPFGFENLLWEGVRSHPVHSTLGVCLGIPLHCGRECHLVFCPRNLSKSFCVVVIDALLSFSLDFYLQLSSSAMGNTLSTPLNLTLANWQDIQDTVSNSSVTVKKKK